MNLSQNINGIMNTDLQFCLNKLYMLATSKKGSIPTDVSNRCTANEWSRT